MSMTTGYLSPVSWWMKWIAEGMPESDNEVVFDKHGGYNHCMIDSPNGPLQLTVPVQKSCHKPQLVKDVRISEHDGWRRKHWHALESTYFNSPFFEYYQDDFLWVYEGKQEFLVDFNHDLLTLITDLLDLRHVDLSCDPCRPVSEYYQVFAGKHGFLSDLSVVDLLFNMGSESLITFNNKA